jgi:hypothetical protein
MAAETYEHRLLKNLGWDPDAIDGYIVPGSVKIDWTPSPDVGMPTVAFEIRKSVRPDVLAEAINDTYDIYAARKR